MSRDPIDIARDLRSARAASMHAMSAHAGGTLPPQEVQDAMAARIRDLETELANAVRTPGEHI